MGKATLPRYTKLDTNGNEVVYWVALGECEHITLYDVQTFKGDVIFCTRCNGPTTITVAKHMRPQAFMEQYGGSLNA